MKIGVQFPFAAGPGNHDALRRLVIDVEELGYDSIWLGDHIIIPGEIANMDSYPYGWRFEPGLTHYFPNKSFLDAVSTCGFIAGATTRVEIGVGVFVVPMRNPLDLAKQLASIDVLSGGRLIAGVGAGWMKEEFDALGMPYAKRGARMVEAVALMRQLWSGEPVTFKGDFYDIHDIYCLPRPTRPEGPPIWIGGHSDIALQRTVDFATGWHAIELSPDEFATYSRRLDEMLAAAGRDPREVIRSVAARFRLSGEDLGEARDAVAAYAEAGCEHLVVYATPSRSVDENRERYHTFWNQVAEPAGAR